MTLLPLAAALAQDQDGDGLPDDADSCPTVPAPAPGGAFGAPVALGGEAPWEVAAADLDGDGVDASVGLASFGRAPAAVGAWSRGRDGAWRGEPTAAAGPASALRVADLDGDGRDEVLAVLSPGATSVAWNRRGALGPFEPLFPEQPGGSWSRFVVADLDGDGDPDVAELRREGGGLALWGPPPADRVLAWAENRGGGRIAQPVELAREPLPYAADLGALVAGDFDGDGDADLAVPTRDAASSRWYRREAGGFVGGPCAVSGERALDPQVADLDGDGADDLVLARVRAVDVAAGGPGGLGARAPTGIAPDPGARSLAVVDADEDGDLDLVFAGGRGLSWHEGDGGAFAEAPAALLAGDATGAALVDLDGDGARDLFVAVRTPGSPAWIPARHPGDRDGDGTCDVDDACPADPAAPCADADGDRLSDADEAALGADPGAPDTDGDGVSDGDEDLGGTDPTSADTDGDGVSDGADDCPLHPAPSLLPGVCGRCPADPPPALDRDGDGVADACDRCPDAADPTQGEGYAPGPTFRRAGRPGVGDVDGDGAPDLVFAGPAGLAVARNLGGRRFAAPAAVARSAPADRAEVLDLDDDGVADLVAAREAVTWARGRGDGTWDAPLTLAGVAPRDLAALRVDGRPALAVAGGLDLLVLVDVGGVGTTIPSPRGTRRVAAGDLDGDGLDDLVLVPDAGSVALFRQGDGFAAPEDLGFSAEDVALLDLDDDGAPDLAALAGGVLSWRANDGAGGFGPAVVVDPSVAGTELQAVDLDGDGVLDLAVATEGGLRRFVRGAPGRLAALPHVPALPGLAVLAPLDDLGGADLVVVDDADVPTVALLWSDDLPDADRDGLCDASDPPDAPPTDTGTPSDTGVPAEPRPGRRRDRTCGCGSGVPSPAAGALLALAIARRRPGGRSRRADPFPG